MKRTAVAALLLFCGSAQAADAGKAPQVTSVRVFSGDATITGQKIEVPNKPKVVVSLTTFMPDRQGLSFSVAMSACKSSGP